jgi:type III secretion system YscD/HrpQ family protein
MSAEQNKKDMSASTDEAGRALRWQLAVFDGTHAGAMVDMAQDEWTLVGSAEDCDVVLRDPGVRPHHFALFPSGQRLQLRAIGGDVPTAHAVCASGASVTLDNAQSWLCCGMTLAVGWRDSADWAALCAMRPVAAAAPDDNVADATDDTAASLQGDSEHAAHIDDGGGSEDALSTDSAPIAAGPWLRVRRTAWRLGAGLVAGVLAVTLGGIAWTVIAQKVHARETTMAIAETLKSLQLDELRMIETHSGPPRLQGTLKSETQRAQLLQALSSRGLHPTVDVVTGEQLAATVQNSFRQHGLLVRASYSGAGRVDVHGTASSPLTERVVGDVLAATNAVTQIAVIEDPKPVPPMIIEKASEEPAASVPAATISPASAARDPKRVVGVVGGASPYVVTQDGRYYFVGSVLPDGTQVDRIDGHTVEFSRNGRSMPVQF